jgi:hypothetical protein
MLQCKISWDAAYNAGDGQTAPPFEQIAKSSYAEFATHLDKLRC